MMVDHNKPRAAFTLVELMVVIGIITVLVSILLPAVGRTLESARSTNCVSNLRHLGAAFVAFAGDNQRRLPGNYADLANPDPHHRDWLLGSNNASGTGWLQAPQSGTIFKYLNSNYSAYRCPSLTEVLPDTGRSSNGRFDYASHPCFSGARTSQLPASARFKKPDGTYDVSVIAPLIVEEDPALHINTSNKESGHSTSDKLASTHRGGGYYVGVDFSVNYYVEPAGTDSRNWEGLTPSGSWFSLGTWPAVWGSWDSR